MPVFFWSHVWRDHSKVIVNLPDVNQLIINNSYPKYNLSTSLLILQLNRLRSLLLALTLLPTIWAVHHCPTQVQQWHFLEIQLHILSEPIETLFWFDFKECKQLIKYMFLNASRCNVLRIFGALMALNNSFLFLRGCLCS